MPRAGSSSEWQQAREDEIAHFLRAKDEHVDNLRAFARLMYARRAITEAYYHDIRDSLDYVAGALLTGKRNTAQLRNQGEMWAVSPEPAKQEGNRNDA